MTPAEQAHHELVLSLLVERQRPMARWRPTPAPGVGEQQYIVITTDAPEIGAQRLRELFEADDLFEQPLRAVS